MLNSSKYFQQWVKLASKKVISVILQQNLLKLQLIYIFQACICSEIMQTNGRNRDILMFGILICFGLLYQAVPGSFLSAGSKC